MEIQVLGLKVALPKLYLECTCGAKGVSITRLLTGLSSGDSSSELALRAAYCASQQSYSQASRDLEVHSGAVVGRTTVRHLALTVELQAMQFVEDDRTQALVGVSHEARKERVARLMVQGDSGMVRTGTLVPCQPGDPSYAKKTPKTEHLRRKRPTHYREVITLDVRQPEEVIASALDVVVPVFAPEGERARRMLALAARKGLGDNTEVFGVGDLGSQLPESFDEAFTGNTARYSGDWKHTCDYVYGVAAVLMNGAKRWTNQMKDAIWKRAKPRVERLLQQAKKTRVKSLPPSMGRVGGRRGTSLRGVAVSELPRCLNPHRRPFPPRRSSNRTCGFPASGSRTDFTPERATSRVAPAPPLRGPDAPLRSRTGPSHLADGASVS